MSTLLKRNDHPKFYTSYSLSYPPPPETSIVHYRNFPFLVEQQPGSHSTDIPTGTHKRARNLNRIKDISPALGLGRTSSSSTLHWAEDKPIVRASWPQDVVSPKDPRQHGSSNNDSSNTGGASGGHAIGAPAGNMIDDICRRSFYEATSMRAGKEYALPVPTVPKPTRTLEADADAARLKPKRFDARPGTWQQFSTQWDRVQLRESPSAEERVTLPNITENQKIAQDRVKVTKKWTCALKQMVQPPAEDMPHFNRLLPGYGGYLSRMPTMNKMMDIDEQLETGLCSTARFSYRRIPPQEYMAGGFARNGPLSRTVTLTYPYNPFSKAL